MAPVPENTKSNFDENISLAEKFAVSSNAYHKKESCKRYK